MCYPTIAVFARCFLPISETFIYRQLVGLNRTFPMIVLTPETQNLERFAFTPIYQRASSGIDRFAMRLYRQMFNRFAWLSPLQYFTWRKIVRKQKVALIHAHYGYGGLDMLPIAQSTRLPLLVTFHGQDASKWLSNSRYVFNLKRLFAYAEIITVSRAMETRLIELGANPTRIRTHHIGVPLEDFVYTDREPLGEKVAQGKPIRFLQVSRLAEKKGGEYTLRAFAGFRRGYSRSELVLAGDGPMRGELEKLCHQLNITDSVRFEGQIPTSRVIELMTSADVYLHHSITASDGDQEGIPISLMEAMATGLVCISTYHSGIPELIAHGQNGFLVQERDVNGYTEQMRQVLACDSSVGRRATNTVRQNFDLAKQNEVLKDIYSEIIRGEHI